MLHISAIIPHAGGRDILRDCLKSLSRTTDVKLQVIVVDNSTISDIDDDTLSIIPSVQILRYECKLGFAGACNRGVDAADGDYVFLLNNDAIVQPDSISKLAKKLADNPLTGACQPKILSLVKPGYFDYSSAAGGELDRFGYPFARGRVFGNIEQDVGQYDDDRDVFWGAGAALMIRRELYLQAGGLEEPFFAHMEEIDLLWRIHLMGYNVVAVSGAVVLHRGAMTIQNDSFQKIYLNHRNSIAMLFRNYGAFSLIRNLPVRVILDKILILYSIIRGDFKRIWAVTRAGCWFWISLPYLIGSRRRVQKLRRVPDKIIRQKLFAGSIVWQYYVNKHETWNDIQVFRKKNRTRQVQDT